MYDDHLLSEFSEQTRASQIGTVTQDIHLFNRTIKENISYSNPSASEEQVIEAAKAALAHDFVMSLPEKYDTVVGEDGCKLSGGQKQRISIARALLSKPSVLVLDEYSAALDADSEWQVYCTLEELRKRGLTQVLVAHRLCTIYNADNIIYFQDGEAIACGHHKTLFKNCEPYRKLCMHQKIGEEGGK